MPESACLGKSESIGLRSDRVPFSSIPGQSRLFLDYLRDRGSLREYYPSSVARHDELINRVPDVLDNYSTDRTVLCQVLSEQNSKDIGCRQVFENIARLQEADCVAVLTGQQAGLFTGPLYTVYKALTAIRSVECLRDAGVNAVPVFWIATEDHDFAEVSNAFAVSAAGTLEEAKFTVAEDELGKAVGEIRADESLGRIIDHWLTSLPATEFSNDLRDVLTSAYISGTSFGDSFGKLLNNLFGKYGLVLFDPLDPTAKRLSSPIYRNAIESSDAIVQALVTRSRKLESTGYHAQVLTEEDHVPLFWTDDQGKRRALKRHNNRFQANGTKTTFSREELLSIADSNPERLSPGVMLRPVVQDFLFPTLCYFGGSAEIAYFAQNSEVYRVLGRPVTPIMHRQSFTIVEAKHARTMEKYGLEFLDLFAGLENLLPKIIERVIDPETPAVFAHAEEEINNELNRLDQQLSKIDPTLADNLANRRRKIIYHIGALRNKFQRTAFQNDGILKRQVSAMFATLLPHGVLQERKVNFASFADRHGMEFIDWIYDRVDPDNTDHQLLYL
jgi:bacillithiol biosynthesis cysteine-adding enzyme BshC